MLEFLRRHFPTLAELEPEKWMLLPIVIMVWWAIIFCTAERVLDWYYGTETYAEWRYM